MEGYWEQNSIDVQGAGPDREARCLGSGGWAGQMPWHPHFTDIGLIVGRTEHWQTDAHPLPTAMVL